MKKNILTFVLILAAALTGCATKPAVDEPLSAIISAETMPGDSLPQEKGVATPPDGSAGVELPLAVSGDELLFGSVVSSLDKIYFGYDSYVVDKTAGDAISANVSRLKGKLSGRKVNLHGHCDQRGSADYNLALGQKRAEAVRQYLITLGLDPAGLEVLSFGKERPDVPGEDEAALAKNRRVEFAVK